MTTEDRGVSAHERRVRPLPAELREEAAKSVCHVSMCSASLLLDAADEIERLTACLMKANEQTEHFERLWYLTKEDAERYAFIKTLEGQVVTMETFKIRGAAELDQALDDAMAEDADARECPECHGKGWNDAWKKVASHYMGGEVFREDCNHCEGTGHAAA